jgi:hypothetical protein
MAASKAGTGAGAVLNINTVSTTYVPIAQLKSFQFTGQKWSTDDVTNTGSPAVGVGVIKEITPSVLDYGEMTLSGVWLYSDTGQQTLLANFQDGAITNFKCVLAYVEGESTVHTEYDFSAYITDMPAPDITFDKALTFKANLKLNSIPTITTGA